MLYVAPASSCSLRRCIQDLETCIVFSAYLMSKGDSSVVLAAFASKPVNAECRTGCGLYSSFDRRNELEFSKIRGVDCSVLRRVPSVIVVQSAESTSQADFIRIGRSKVYLYIKNMQQVGSENHSAQPWRADMARKLWVLALDDFCLQRKMKI